MRHDMPGATATIGFMDLLGRVKPDVNVIGLFAATDNEFIVSLSSGVTAGVAALNDYKERVQPLTRDPAPDHERIYDAVAAKDANGARDAMATLLRLAIADTPMQGRRTARAENSPVGAFSDPSA